jgi:hypothetical protein
MGAQGIANRINLGRNSTPAPDTAARSPVPIPLRQISPSPGPSIILVNLTDICPTFAGRTFALLWRGSRDGFLATDFHRLCDSHRNTLTIIKDRAGHVFGGFTPIPWSSRTSPPYEVSDESGESFLFAFTNPQITRPMLFPLKPEQRKQALFCRGSSGPRFGVSDLIVSTNCHLGGSHTEAGGQTYALSPGAPPFMKATPFTVAEIETFQVTA